MSKRSAGSFITSRSTKSEKRTRSLPASSCNNDSAENEFIDLTNDENSCDGGNIFPSAPANASFRSSVENSNSYNIYCDLDGVLVDFNKGVRKIFNGRGPDQLPPHILWSGITRANDFFEHLPWTNDGKDLWDELLLHYNGKIDILTGVPRNKEAREQKFLWCQRELGVSGVGDDDSILINHVDMAGPKNTHDRVKGIRKKEKVNVITCWSKNKYYESRIHAVLIDDNIKFKKNWEKNGGIFIHHERSSLTLEILREHGILPLKNQPVGHGNTLNVIDIS